MADKKIHIVKPSEVWSEAIEHRRIFPNQSPKYAPTGFNELDKHFKMFPGEHLIIYGLPGHGKTTALFSILINQAKTKHYRTVIFAPEEFSTSHIVRKLTQSYLSKEAGKMTEQEDVEAKSFINNHFLIIECPRLGTKWSDLKHAVTTAHKEFKFNNLVIDHAMMLEKSEKMHEDNVRFFMNEMIEFSQQLKFFTYVVNHVAKPTMYFDRDLKKRYIPPQLAADMAHGQMWERLAFNILEVYKPDPDIYKTAYGECWLNLRKVKNEDAGETWDRIKTYYDRNIRNFTDVEPVNELDYDKIF